MNTSKTPIYLLIFCSSLVACTNIEGTYVANHKLGFDTVKLFTNNKYVRIYYTPDKLNSFRDTGTWNYSNGAIYFHDWVDRNGMNYYEGKGLANFGAEINRNIFNIGTKLVINYDLEYYYIKQ